MTEIPTSLSGHTIASTPADPKLEQEMAWVGDAVLGLYAREWVLREKAGIDTGMFLNLTSNSFLGGLGRPTKVEAEIGVVYREKGLVDAFAYIESRILPLFKTQEARRQRQRKA